MALYCSYGNPTLFPYCFQRNVDLVKFLMLHFINRSSNVLVIDLGHVKITSDPEQERVVSTKVILIR